MKSISIKDKEFELFIPEQRIVEAVKQVAVKINEELAGKDPLFVCVLNGSFMFASELMKFVTIPCQISFVRVSSYHGTTSGGEVKEIYGLDENIENRTIVVLEDIVDTGTTISLMIQQLHRKMPKEIKIGTLLFKPEALKHPVHPDYVALEIPNDFIVGFGLDYDGYGRNLADIYKIKS